MNLKIEAHFSAAEEQGRGSDSFFKDAKIQLSSRHTQRRVPITNATAMRLLLPVTRLPAIIKIAWFRRSIFCCHVIVGVQNI